LSLFRVVGALGRMDEPGGPQHARPHVPRHPEARVRVPVLRPPHENKAVLRALRQAPQVHGEVLSQQQVDCQWGLLFRTAVPTNLNFSEGCDKFKKISTLYYNF
jgi:hypothetical protein